MRRLPPRSARTLAETRQGLRDQQAIRARPGCECCCRWCSPRPTGIGRICLPTRRNGPRACSCPGLEGSPPGRVPRASHREPSGLPGPVAAWRRCLPTRYRDGLDRRTSPRQNSQPSSRYRSSTKCPWSPLFAPGRFPESSDPATPMIEARTGRLDHNRYTREVALPRLAEAIEEARADELAMKTRPAREDMRPGHVRLTRIARALASTPASLDVRIAQAIDAAARIHALLARGLGLA